MSLFDVIKYQISNPPTKEEIDALPTSILVKYNITPDWRFSGHTYEVYQAMKHLEHYPEEVNMIRELIKEYDEFARCT